MYSFTQRRCVKTQTQKVSSQSLDGREAKTSLLKASEQTTRYCQRSVFFPAQEGSVRLALNEGSVLGFSYTVPPTDVKLL